MSARPRLLSPSFLLVTASSLAYFVSVGVLVPTLPAYVERELGGGGLAVGLAVGAFSFSAAVLRPIIGPLGDRRGRRLLVVGGAAVVAVSVAGYVVATNLVILLALRLLTGVGEAALFVGAATAIQDLAPDERRGEAASWFSVAIYGGLAAGPALGEWVLDAGGFEMVWLVAAGGAALSAALGWWTPVRPDPDFDPDRRRRLFHPAALGPGSVLGLALFGFAGFSAFVPLYVDDIGLDGSNLVFLLYGGLVLLVRIGGARLPDRFGYRSTATVALVLQTVGLGLMSLVRSSTGLYASTAVFALGISLMFPSLFAMAIDAAPDSERSEAVSTFSLFFDLATGVGTLALGGVVALASEPAAFAVGAASCGVGLLVLRRFVADPPSTGAEDDGRALVTASASPPPGAGGDRSSARSAPPPR